MLRTNKEQLRQVRLPDVRQGVVADDDAATAAMTPSPWQQSGRPATTQSTTSATVASFTATTQHDCTFQRPLPLPGFTYNLSYPVFNSTSLPRFLPATGLHRYQHPPSPRPTSTYLDSLTKAFPSRSIPATTALQNSSTATRLKALHLKLTTNNSDINQANVHLWHWRRRHEKWFNPRHYAYTWPYSCTIYQQ